MRRTRLPYVSVSALCLLAAAWNTTGCSSDDAAPAEQPTAQPEAGVDVDTSDAADPPDSPTPETDASPEAGASPRLALLTASDFVSVAQLGVINLDAPDPQLQTSSFDDQDTVVVADGRHAFLLHRTKGTVSVLPTDGSSTPEREIDVQPTGTGAGNANPYGVLVPASDKAYVVRYGQNTIAVVDPTGSDSTVKEIDMSEFVTDPDGLVDAFGGVFDPSTGRAYIGLERIDQNEFGGPPDYVGTCLPTRAAVVGIDTATDAVVDLNGAADGKEIALDVANPVAMTLTGPSRLALLGVGCADDPDAGSGRAGRGVQSVDASDGSTAWLWQSQDLARPAALLWIGEHEAIVGLDDDMFTRHWYAWDPASPSLGDELQGVPQVPTWDGERGLVGLEFGTADGGTVLDLARYDLDGKTSTVLVPSAFEATGLTPYSSATAR